MADGNYATLDKERIFGAMPRHPVIGQRLGQQTTATVRDLDVQWRIRRSVA
ncbi:hypothetical protein HQN78_08455 [Chromobacterium sp. Beijing]|nr:hypothetical protein HQN78_08455 [Chromobacterium sp. Beijing]